MVRLVGVVVKKRAYVKKFHKTLLERNRVPLCPNGDAKSSATKLIYRHFITPVGALSIPPKGLFSRFFDCLKSTAVGRGKNRVKYCKIRVAYRIESVSYTATKSRVRLPPPSCAFSAASRRASDGLTRTKGFRDHFSPINFARMSFLT